MTLVEVFANGAGAIAKAESDLNESEVDLLKIAMWASEPIPFDPMEVALHQAYAQKIGDTARDEYKLVFEYPLAGKPPMMTHVFEKAVGDRVIAAKGAPEAILSVCDLSETEKAIVHKAMVAMGEKGYRILGVAEAELEGNEFPRLQTELKFVFKGLVAFYDPPKSNIGEVLKGFYGAGMKVKIITGDNDATTRAIAEQIGFVGFEKSISGDELLQLTDVEIKSKVEEINIFTRMFPEAKLKIINALKEQGEIVAMTGDGVNDGPALKAAHIGIAMGKKGTEIAKQAASLILLEDDFSKMLDAVAMGRRIYTNLKKAIRYIISIHIPIILTVFLPLALGWIYPNIFSPIHIIFLELIMGPTCSIIYENEPMEKDTMQQNPRPFTTTFFNWRELFMSIIQGLAITAGALGIYQYAIHNSFSEDAVRTMVFTVMITANIFLTLINRSFRYSIFTTLKYKNNLVFVIIGITILISSLLLLVPVLSRFFEFQILTAVQLAFSIAVGFVSVIWIEVVKAVRRVNS
jgi:Ca2+-transporting ATPase